MIWIIIQMQRLWTIGENLKDSLLCSSGWFVMWCWSHDLTYSKVTFWGFCMRTFPIWIWKDKKYDIWLDHL